MNVKATVTVKTPNDARLENVWLPTRQPRRRTIRYNVLCSVVTNRDELTCWIFLKKIFYHESI